MLWLTIVSLASADCGPAGCPDRAVEAELTTIPEGPRPAPPFDDAVTSDPRIATFALG